LLTLFKFIIPKRRFVLQSDEFFFKHFARKMMWLIVMRRRKKSLAMTAMMTSLKYPGDEWCFPVTKGKKI